MRARKRGEPFENIADQLGHANTAMGHKVYGRFKRTIEERLAASATITATAHSAPYGKNSAAVQHWLEIANLYSTRKWRNW